MAVYQIEYKILGRLAKQIDYPRENQILAQALFQVLGLSIQLTPKLVKARKLRKLDVTRDTKSLQLYHHIIWLAREGLSITEVYILPYCQNGEQGPEYRVMAAKLRASLYHVFCLFHNHPPISAISPRMGDSASSSSGRTPKSENGRSKKSPGKSPRNGKEGGEGRRRSSKSGLRDLIPSMTSDASYITNPFAGPAATPPPPGPPPPIPSDSRRTPTWPPGLAPINISPARAAASFLLPPLNFVPMAREHFETAQQLAVSLLSPTNALRLSVSLDHAAFLWECEKEHDRARKLARKTIKEVYSSTEGLDDDEFGDASILVQALGGIVKRSSNDAAVRQPSREQLATTRPPIQQQQPTLPRQAPRIDRTIAVSPPTNRGARTASHPPMQTQPQQQRSSIMRTPERLSTVPEVDSQHSSESQTLTTGMSPPVSHLSSRSQGVGQRRPSSSASNQEAKAAKRRAVEQAEEIYLCKNGNEGTTSVRSNRSGRSRNGASSSGGGGGDGRRGSGSDGRGSRQSTPPESYVSHSHSHSRSRTPRSKRNGR
jgi:hypothetical protein